LQHAAHDRYQLTARAIGQELPQIAVSLGSVQWLRWVLQLLERIGRLKGPGMAILRDRWN